MLQKERVGVPTMLTIVASTCRGTGAKVLSLELGLHATAETNATTLLIDLSHEPYNSFDHGVNCLSALLLNKINPVQAFYNYRNTSTLLISRLMSSNCLRYLGRSTLPHMREDIIELLIHYIIRNIDIGYNVVLYVPLDYITMKIVARIIKSAFLNKFVNIVLVMNEKKECINEHLINSLENIGGMGLVKAVVFNRIPMGLIDMIKEEILRTNKLYPFMRNKNNFVALLLPLTKQLYYRDLFEYIPLLIKAKTNEHARTISVAFRKLIRIMMGEEQTKSLIGVIRGMISVIPLKEPSVMVREAEVLNRALVEVPWE